MAVFVVLSGCSRRSDVAATEESEGSEKTDLPAFDCYNLKRAELLTDRIFRFIVLTEGIEGENSPYVSGGRWTSAFGITVKPNGDPITEDDYISLDSAMAWSKFHLRKRVVPFFKFFDEKKLSDAQIIGIAVFIYRVGGERCTGRRLDGEPTGEPSMFFKAMQRGASDEECVACLTRFRKTGGVVANGLLKRCWIEGAALMGILTPDNIMDLKPLRFYDTKNLGEYYFVNEGNKPIEVNGMYQLKYTDWAVNTFFEKNCAFDGEMTVKDII